MSALKAFAEQLRAQQKKHGMTQEQFSKFLGISVNALSCYVLGKKVPSLDIVATIAEKLGITIGELCGETATGMPKTITCADAIRQIKWLQTQEWCHPNIAGGAVVIEIEEPGVVRCLATEAKLNQLVQMGKLDARTSNDLQASCLIAAEKEMLC